MKFFGRELKFNGFDIFHKGNKPTKDDVGLGNVDNTSDSAKPISTATQTALNGKVNNSQVLTNVPSGAKFTDTIYTHPSTHPASMITESTSQRFVSDIEKAKWDDQYRGNWDTVRFTVSGDAHTYYPVVLTGLHMNEATMSTLEIYRAYSWQAPDTWNSPTHKGGLNLSIDYSLAGWGGQNYELQLTLSQAYSKIVGDVVTALPDTCVIIVWLRGGTALYELRRQSKDVRVTVHDGIQNPVPFKHKEGTQYENVYEAKTVVESWFNFTGIKKLLTTESQLFIGGGYRNPKNSVQLYHEGNKPTKLDVGLSSVDNIQQATKSEFNEHNIDGVKHITGAERTAWNNKSNLALGTSSSTAYRGDLGNTAYTHSQSTHARTDATNTVNHATNGSITVNGVQQVVYTHPTGTNPHGTTKADIGLSAVDNTSNANMPVSIAQQAALNLKANLASPSLTGTPTAPTATVGNNTTQIATTAFVQSSLSGAGLGDMLKSIYDKDGDGVVDVSKGIVGDDTRNINSPPSEYMSAGSRYLSRAGWQTEFKSISTMGLSEMFSGMYCYVETKNPWSDPSGGYPIQIAYGDGSPQWRVGKSLATWSAWEKMNDNGNASTVNGFTVGINVPANAKFTDTIYTHPSTHPASMITGLPTSLPTYHVSKTDTSDKNLLWINTNL